MHVEYLLVDGYNIIHAWEDLKIIAEGSLESARDKLVDIMSNYQGFKKIKVIVVFDAHKVKGSIGKIYQHQNIMVVFTKEAETADHYIEKIAHDIGCLYRVRVATSDALEQIIILGRGATRVSARELYDEVNLMENTIRQQYIEKQSAKKNALETFLDPKVADWMEKLRRQK